MMSINWCLQLHTSLWCFCPRPYFANTGLSLIFVNCIELTCPSRKFCRSHSPFVTDCPWGVWGHGLTIGPLYIGALFGKSILNQLVFKWIMSFLSFMYINTLGLLRFDLSILYFISPKQNPVLVLECRQINSLGGWCVQMVRFDLFSLSNTKLRTNAPRIFQMVVIVLRFQC